MKYKALKNITGTDLIRINDEELTAEQLGGQESVERLIRLGAIEEMPTGKKAKAVEPEDDGKPVKAAGPTTKEK